MNAAIAVALVTLVAGFAFDVASLLPPAKIDPAGIIVAFLCLVGIWGIVRKLIWARVFDSILFGVGSIFLLITTITLGWTTGFSLATVIVLPELLLSVVAFLLTILVHSYRSYFVRKGLL